ncbi:hypothetical protein RFI_13134 [Reticulomyxa filosa]|uniref:Uncharacterized protein n=1 Tax=Reticulomyxa filosa TaxID=46433 RepID=X6NE56_RETFI|nr:hypothetical protein RFI_13134 [Reticulomyxa filosa]|eukprot:ETO24024.1 hypothetical protein RFI_13134 [Reticulomyxa filosa]
MKNRDTKLNLWQVVYEKGYSHIYLCTRTASKFYEHLGYKHCNKQKATEYRLRRNRKRLNVSQLSSLESMLNAKKTKNNKDLANTTAKKAEKKNNQHCTVSKNDGGGNNDDDGSGGDDNDGNDCDARQIPDTDEDIWYFKKLRMLMPPTWRNASAWMGSIRNQFQLCYGGRGEMIYHTYNMPWVEQIGPCCGFAALAMMEYFAMQGRSSLASKTYDLVLTNTVMKYALDNGYTKCGELFDLEQYLWLCNLFLLESKVNIMNMSLEDCSVSNLTTFVHSWMEKKEEVLNIFDSDCPCLIVPYWKDSTGRPTIQEDSQIGRSDINLSSDSCSSNRDHVLPVASRAHYLVICGAIRVSAAQEDNSYGWLIGTHSSKFSPVVVSVKDLVQSNALLKGKCVPKWAMNKYNLCGKMISVKFSSK